MLTVPAPPRPRVRTLGLVVIGTVLAACGGSAVLPATDGADDDIAEARRAVAEAQTVGAATEAPVEFQEATSRLENAEQSLAAGDVAGAARRAQEAAVAARLAELTVLASRAAEARASYDEIRALRTAVDSALAQ